MPFVTSIERLGIARGWHGAILATLSTRFEQVPEEIVAHVGEIYDEALLQDLHRQALTLSSVEQFRQALEQSRRA